MSKILRSTMFNRIMILLVLTLGLSFVLLVKNVQSVQAVACCYDCEAAEQQCWEACNWGGPNQDDSCPYTSMYQCMQQTGVLFCYQHCTYEACGGGGCTGSWDCPPGCYCTGYSCQCF